MDYLEAIKGYNVRDAVPSRAALLVIDMQRYFAGVASPILENVWVLVRTCRLSGLEVVFTRHGH